MDRYFDFAMQALTAAGWMKNIYLASNSMVHAAQAAIFDSADTYGTSTLIIQTSLLGNYMRKTACCVKRLDIGAQA